VQNLHGRAIYWRRLRKLWHDTTHKTLYVFALPFHAPQTMRCPSEKI
jgi:hypothetical protein